jgi:hypothetical protein
MGRAYLRTLTLKGSKGLHGSCLPEVQPLAYLSPKGNSKEGCMVRAYMRPLLKYHEGRPLSCLHEGLHW